MRKVEIQGKGYELKYGLKALFEYEQIAGKPYEGATLKESYLLMHAALIANNGDYALTFEELIAECDEDGSIFEAFTEELMAAVRRQNEHKKKVTEQMAAR